MDSVRKTWQTTHMAGGETHMLPDAFSTDDRLICSSPSSPPRFFDPFLEPPELLLIGFRHGRPEISSHARGRLCRRL